jgi:hypothetical protein
MLDIFLSKFKLLLKSPMILFIYGIIAKWYVMVMIPAVIVAYWVLQGLTEAGIFQATEKVVTTALSETKSIARYCTPKITRLGDFWDCLQNPPKYEPTQDEVKLEKNLKDLLDFEKYDSNKDPYAEKDSK